MKQPEELVVGDTLSVVYIGGARKYLKITGIDDIFYRDRHTPLAMDSTESFAAITALNPPIDQIYWIYEIETDGNVRVLLKQPAATNRWGTNTAPQGGMIFDFFAPKCDIWIAEDYPPNIQIVNNSCVTITPVLWWIGRRFAVKEVEKPAAYTTVKIGGLPE